MVNAPSIKKSVVVVDSDSDDEYYDDYVMQ